MQATMTFRGLNETHLEQQYYDKKVLLETLSMGGGEVPGVRWTDAFWGFLGFSFTRSNLPYQYRWLLEQAELQGKGLEFYQAPDGKLLFVVV